MCQCEFFSYRSLCLNVCNREPQTDAGLEVFVLRRADLVARLTGLVRQIAWSYLETFSLNVLAPGLDWYRYRDI
jgi:hypothetical protein